MAGLSVQPLANQPSFGGVQPTPPQSLGGVQPIQPYSQVATAPGMVATWAPSPTGSSTNSNVNNLGATNTGTTTVDPNATTPGQVSQVQNYVGQLNDLYNQLFGNVANEAAFQRQGLETGSQDQQNQLRNAYTGQSYNLYNTMGARGLSDSSYSADAQNLANKTYTDEAGSTQDQLKLAEGQLGSQLGGQVAGWKSAQNQLGMYTPDYLTGLSKYGVANLLGNLGQRQTDLSGTLGTFGTQQGFLNALNLQAPSQVFNPQQLPGQLQGIAQSPAPPSAQGAEAGSAAQQYDPTNSNYWLNWFQNLGNGSPTA